MAANAFRQGSLVELTGWGRYPKSKAYLYPLTSPADAILALGRRGGLSVLGRGAGRAYGDSAQNAGNMCLDFMPANRFLEFDPATGRLHAEAGVTLEQVLQTFIPKGWFLPVTPGTKFPTLGGCVACDVHGKSHYPFSQYLERIHLLLADGSVTACSRQERPELFWATTGGMGLTGLILSVEIKLMPIESSYLKYEGLKARDLEGIFRIFEESESSPLTVAWMDCVARGKQLGRSIMMRGDFARRQEVKSAQPLAVAHKPKVIVPFDFPSWSLNKLSVAAFNAVIYGKHPQRLDTLMDYESFFYPLDSVLRWNLIYGKPGLVQYQFLIPPKHGFEGIKTLLEAITRSGRGSFLAVLKKFGPMQNEGMLSFPEPGYFLALDFPVANGEIFKDMDQWDEQVLKFGGRLYLAKDARMKKETFNAMYPRLPEWRAVKAQVDPENIFCSDQARRLGLV
jgi:decaprenylphospho-beta-D-ribofuranose 2-oxidase